MSFIQNFFTSRDNQTDGNTYVGQEGRLWYNPLTNSIYVNTANIPGGTPVALATGANITANNLTVNSITSTSGNISVTGNLVISGNISPASNVKVGGIKAGPGVDIANDGTLTIDTANLPLSFGDFTASNNILTIVNVDENMILATQGNAEIQLIGNIGFYKTNGLPPSLSNRYFQATDDGQIVILVPNTDPLLGAVQIIGSASGQSVSPALAGVMLHITGQTNDFASQYIDGVNNFANYIGRRYNGNAVVPTQVLAGNTIVRFSGQGYSTGGFNAPADGSISLDALENFTQSNQGAIWRFTVNPVGGNVRQEVANISVANGVTATQFNTSGNISATGNITSGNLTLTTGGIISSSGLISTTANISGGNILTGGQVSATGNVTAGNVNAYVALPAGTTSKAPLTFTTGNILATPVTASVEYDGRLYYGTPQDQERGLLKTAQTYILNTDYALTDQTAAQSLFGVSAGVSSNTRYVYVINAVVYKTSNNITMSYALQGNAVVARHSYQTTSTASSSLATLSTPSVLRNILTTGFATPVVVTAALNGAGYYSLYVTGVINVTTAGTWNPLIAFSGLPGAGSYVSAGSSVEIYPVGPGNTTVSIGNWT